MKTTVIHHSADFDGIFCREIARKFLPDAELIGWDFSDAPLEITEGKIYILDLPVDRVFGFDFSKMGADKNSTLDSHISISQPESGVRKFLQAVKCIIWIDHHKSSIESHPSDIPGYRIDGVAACRLAWQFFLDLHDVGMTNTNLLPKKEMFTDRLVTEPLSVRLAGEYDIWDKRDDRADVFQFGLRSKELSENDWRELLSDNWRPTVSEIEMVIAAGKKIELKPDGTATSLLLTELLERGKLLQTYQQRNDAGMMHRSFLVEFEGLKFLALTTARCNSLTFMAKDVLETGHDALMGFYYDGTRWNVSLYHAKHRTDLDLSVIAVKHGGGGHRGACGFKISKLPFAT